MPEVNYEWVNQQMAEAKVKIGSGKAVMELLRVWESMEKLSPGIAKEAVSVFSKLALNKSILEVKDEPDSIWTPVQPGQIIVGDEVRVISDAFDDKTGVLHNGRRGKVIAVRYGDIIVNSIDGKSPDLKGVHYSPYKLEKRIK
jgi:transcription antitermination factor NusG